MKNKPIKILAIGSLPPPLGGTSVLFKNLVNALKSNVSTKIWVINTSGIRNGNIFLSFFKFIIIILRLFIISFRVDAVTLHCSPVVITMLGPFVFGIARLARKPYIIRKFNGIDYMELGWFLKKIAHFIVRHANIYLVETKQLVKNAKELGLKNVRWYPNSRLLSNKKKPELFEGKCCRRFVFVGRVEVDKGIFEIIEIDNQLPSITTIDVYGPFSPGISECDFEVCKNIHYKGILPPGEVIDTLKRYDALLLPTYHASEGYPGVIIEAYAAGIPVICTQWRQLPEIVDESSGILIPPRDCFALLEAIKAMVNNCDIYHHLCKGAWKKRSDFSSEVWNERFISYCRELARNT
jgi:glycosyltransferase involved in cell wall biosynthesis